MKMDKNFNLYYCKIFPKERAKKKKGILLKKKSYILFLQLPLCWSCEEILMRSYQIPAETSSPLQEHL